MSQFAITFEDVQAAVDRLAGVAHRTPVLTSRTVNRLTGYEVYFKCENFQRGGAFKFRGAYNALAQLSQTERRRGVVAFSSGNHAQGVAYAAQLLDIPATIDYAHRMHLGLCWLPHKATAQKSTSMIG